MKSIKIRKEVDFRYPKSLVPKPQNIFLNISINRWTLDLCY